ncbi:MAG TPA: lysylphosphatidylglycerol synthase transmembrane domain-containing protein [Acidobacteriaceae bacterium]|nr:lysylphosphatidylglycerol synthase transmembrane domain-containing protein [Acidobacteriaceae bacterium]
MKSRKALVILAVAIILAVIVFANRGKIQFNWTSFGQQLHHISWLHIAIGVALIYSTYWLRSARWAVFISATKKVPPFSLVGPQFIGFTAVALIGRLADITRPALVAKKVGLPVSSQLAVYTIERMFDLGAAALIFSSALIFIPHDMAHRDIFVRTGLFSLAGTAGIAIFAVVLRVAGEAVARIVHGLLHPLSAPIAESVATKIRGFRDGLNAISSAHDFLLTALISLAMWGLIGMAYVETLHAFVESPQLATLRFSQVMLLMGASIAASIFQIPIIGWFTQIGATAIAMVGFYGASKEAATACGALLLFVTFLSIIPAGLIAARLNHVSLRGAATQAEDAEAAEDSNPKRDMGKA